jgi:hypothetical protein
MKIIGITHQSEYSKGFLVEINDTELRQICGKNYGHIGSTFDVQKNYDLLRNHEDSQARLSQAANTLRALADLCDQQAPSLIAPVPAAPKAPAP